MEHIRDKTSGVSSLEGPESASGLGLGTLASRAYDLLDECGHALSADVLVAHCFGKPPSRNLEFWRGQLARVLANNAIFVQQGGGAWGLMAWSQAEAAFNATDYVVIDLETTGLSARAHCITELAAVRCRGNTVLATLSTLVKPRRRPSAFIQSYTGITSDMLADAPDAAAVLPDFLNFIGSDPLVGHNIAFDLAFLHAELARVDAGRVLTNRTLDTGRLAARLLPHLGKPSLDRLCATLGLVANGRHRAEADALLTARVLWQLAERSEQQGTVTFSGLISMAVPSRAPGTSVAGALRGQRRTGRTLLDPALRQNLPQKPGVYLMKDAAGTVIYVGKAKRLRDRVSSYYAHPLGYVRKMDGLLESVDSLDTIVVGSELEALLLESRLIKHYQPRFNVQQRYYTHYPFIRVDVASAYPRVSACRDIGADGARYFGPFRSMRAVRATIEIVQKLFRLRECTRALTEQKLLLPEELPRRRRGQSTETASKAAASRAGHSGHGSPCFRYHIGRCLGPCHGGVNSETYHREVDDVLNFLGSNRDDKFDVIRTQMEEASEREDFERAAALRDVLIEAQRLLAAQTMLDGAVERHNVLILAPSADEGAVEIFAICHGRLFERLHLVLAPSVSVGEHKHGDGNKRPTPRKQVWAFLARLTASTTSPTIIGQAEVDQIVIITRWMFNHQGAPTIMPLPVKPNAGTVRAVLAQAQAVLSGLAAGGDEDGDWETGARLIGAE